MYLSTGEYLHAFIHTKLPINYQVIYRLNDLDTKENDPEMTKRYPFSTYKYNETQK